LLADFIIQFLSSNNISSGPLGCVSGCSPVPGAARPPLPLVSTCGSALIPYLLGHHGPSVHSSLPAHYLVKHCLVNHFLLWLTQAQTSPAHWVPSVVGTSALPPCSALGFPGTGDPEGPAYLPTLPFRAAPSRVSGRHFLIPLLESIFFSP
jgi:hypothetical protein